MVLLQVLHEDDKIITFEMEADDEREPEYGDVILCQEEDNDECIVLGHQIYNKFGILTYEILERDAEFDDEDEDDE